ncbi:MAG TPA: hydroxyisourate hydrolase [Longimicrobiales bacterium]|nr:hydroxyisourate hydrolase [Longimicrobiales bacterium]
MITTHILDTALGKPAANVGVTVEQMDAYGAGHPVAQGRTDADGRIKDLLKEVQPGRYRLIFETGAYFLETKREGFYPEVTVTVEIRDANQHYHVPLLLNPFGYSTYRGS